MARSNARVASLLREYASILAMDKVEAFKIKAYRRAADTLDLLDQDVSLMVQSGVDLTQLPTIGRGISRTIEAIVKTGRMPQLADAHEHLTPRDREFLAHPALDPKKALRVYKKLNIGSLDELKTALNQGAIGQSFGTRLESDIRRGLDERPRLLLKHAMMMADKIEAFLKSIRGVGQVAIAGSVRRRQETVGDLNFVVSGSEAEAVFREFNAFGGVTREECTVAERAIFRLSKGVTIDLTWTVQSDWGWTLLHRTGSIEHLRDLEQQSIDMGISFTPDGLRKAGINLSTERRIYEGLGLSFIEPELREARGEIQASVHGNLPKLVSGVDLNGDLHMHTTASDGKHSLVEMAEAARRHKYRYIAITDHSQSLRIAHGLSERQLAEQLEQIDELNANLNGFKILKSAEVDILEDGQLDYPDDLLAQLDLTVCSIHSRFQLDREHQTARILRAMDNPYFTILGHATGRLLLQRNGYDLDMERIIRQAKANGCFLEINSSPNRLDISDEIAIRAKSAGVKVAINTDAHSVQELDTINWGINQARRGWLEKADILNSLPLRELQKRLRRS